MILDYMKDKEPVINEYFCRGRHNNSDKVYLNQNLLSLDRQNVRENCNIFMFFEQRGNVLQSIQRNFIMEYETSVIKYGESLMTTLFLINLKKILMVS